ncbi:hypothetical protein [Nibricoccus sp. IMCC34717]|uniref:hypothetical protein n=1 Tax=Nibricoccus sp. IMCC34717 TaxID=3034021 RepID=UPI00384DF08F
METNLRDFSRNLSRYRKAADQGHEVRVRDRNGRSYRFIADTAEPQTLAEAAGEYLGAVASGRARKSMAGYGKTPRDR